MNTLPFFAARFQVSRKNIQLFQVYRAVLNMFSNIVLSGGGLAGIAYLGCLKYLEEDTELKQTIKNILGVSSGALFALILAMDITYEEAKAWVQQLSHIRVNHVNVRSVKLLMENYGLDDGEGVKDIVRSLYRLRDVDDNITFTDLAKRFGKNLIVAAANVNRSKLTYFSVDETPSMRVMEAIRASTAIPLVFVPVIYKEDYFVDAFVFDNFPFGYFQDQDFHTFGLNLIAEQSDTKSCMTFFAKVFYAIIENHSHKHHDNECVVRCSSNGFNLKKMRFEVDENSFDDTVKQAYDTVSEFIARKKRDRVQPSP